MTIQEVFQQYEEIFASIVDGYGTAETEALYDEGIYAVTLKTAINDTVDRGETCGAELADEIQKYPHVQYYVNLMWLRS